MNVVANQAAAPIKKDPYVIGPDGTPLTLKDLPPPTTKRWVIRRKAEVVAAVRGGLLTLEEACERYTLTVEEFLSWAEGHRSAWTAGTARNTRSAIPVIPPKLLHSFEDPRG